MIIKKYTNIGMVKLNEKEKLKKLKEKEKLKKLKEKEKLIKLKEKEKLKKLKEKEKTNRKNKYKVGGVLTRETKKYVSSILQSWEIEMDADDYFDNWVKTLNITPENINKKTIDKKINEKSFLMLNYNMLTDLQKIKDLFFRKSFSSLNFDQIRNEISDYSFIRLLTYQINDFTNDENDKKILFFGILKNVISVYISLTENIFNDIVFQEIGEKHENVTLYRSWRRFDQLSLMKLQSNFDNTIDSELITDNYLSSSIEKDLALKFYFDSSLHMPDFTLWEVEVPKKYPYLHVTDQLNEILIHIGAKLQYKGYEFESNENFNYKIEKYKWVGFCPNKTQEIIEKYKYMLNYIEKIIII